MHVRAPPLLLGGSCLLWATLAPAVGKDLPYPKGVPDADTIAQNVYFVNHAYAVRNLSQRQDGDRAAFMLIRAADGSTRLYTFERFLNNDYDDGVTKARDLAVFRSGNLRGTGILTTVHQDERKRQDVLVWMPALRKARRHAEPPLDDAWGGSNLTYADIYLRKPEHETHELLGRETFDACLDFPEPRGDLPGTLLRHAPEPRCDHKGRAAYKLKSTSRSPNCCYDYRIQYVDTTSFADYRTVYYQAEKPVKVLDKDWVSMGLADPRGQYARYWYARSLDSAVESLYAVPDGLTRWDTDTDPSLWTEAGLGRITR
jgi:hypothetical protein